LSLCLHITNREFEKEVPLKQIHSPILVKSGGFNLGYNFRTIPGTLQVGPHEVPHAKIIGWGTSRLLWFPFLP
jgi:hypothetical protein